MMLQRKHLFLHNDTCLPHDAHLCSESYLYHLYNSKTAPKRHSSNVAFSVHSFDSVPFVLTCVCMCEFVCEGHLDSKATLAAADRLLIRLPLVGPAGLWDVDVFLPAEALA